MAIAELKVGPIVSADGVQVISRADRMGGGVVADGQAHFAEMVARGQVFSLAMQISGTPTAGQIHTAFAAPAAAAITQYAIFNPVGSTKNLHLLKFGYNFVSGTPTAGSLAYGIFNTGALPTALAQTNGTVRNNLVNGPGSVCATSVQAVAAGAALTGGAAPVIHSAPAITTSAFAATVAGSLGFTDLIDGGIIIPPGMGWVPLLPGVGTTHLCVLTTTWAELPV